jgi:predicted ATPase
VPHHLSALANLPDDDAHFPASVWLKNLLKEGVQGVILDPTELRKPSPPLKGANDKFSGANLGRLVAQLLLDEQRSADWQAHLRTVLPDLKAIRTVLREEERSRYVQIQYENGIEVPSWFLSDGTLRLMALTLLAYAPKSEGIYLIEEPENGVHPTALEAIFQSLTSVYEGQVFIATHSPVLLSLTKPEQLLCFSKTSEGTKITRGDQHPVLRDWNNWKGEVNLSDYFAAGVLG